MIKSGFLGLLKVPFPITATGFEKDPATGRVKLVRAKYDKPESGSAFKKPKTYIRWIAKCPTMNSPIKARARLYNPLFKPDNPDSHPDGFLSLVNLNSEEIFTDALIETGFKEIMQRAPWPRLEGESNLPLGNATLETTRFQGMRVGYFCVDRDSTEESIILNRIVSLKEDSKKAA